VGSRLLGLVLLPVVAGLMSGAYALLIQAQRHSGASSTLLWFGAGLGVWLLIYLFLTPSARSYVIAHECSHLLAAWLSGVRAGNLRVGRDGGSVEVARSTIWIALAPYMIPFYAGLVLLAHVLAGLWWDPAGWGRFLPPALGFTWGFHLTFTLQALAAGQSDIRPYGWMGSLPLILAGNLLLFSLGLCGITPEPFAQDLRLLTTHQTRVFGRVWQGSAELWHMGIEKLQ
jgi:hypothetical protein